MAGHPRSTYRLQMHADFGFSSAAGVAGYLADLGGEEARRAFAGRLRGLRLGCVIDMVPNHMSVAVPALNRWWWEVLEQGPQAEHAGHFDIDWAAGRLLLPVLGDDPDELDRPGPSPARSARSMTASTTSWCPGAGRPT